MDKVVIKIGGSILCPEKGPDASFITQISSTLTDINKQAFPVLVVGGGKTASKYVEAGQQLGLSQYQLDNIALRIARENARLLASTLEFCTQIIPETVDEATQIIATGNKPIVMGGTSPGHTTNTVAVLLAESIAAKRVVMVSNVEGVYDKNPTTHKDAKKYSSMKPSQLVKIASEGDSRKARENFIIDILAAKLIARSGIETHVVSGKNLQDVKNAALGKKHNGTVIKP